MPVIFQEVVTADSKYTLTNSPVNTVFDVHNDNPFNFGISFGRDTGIQGADYYASPHSILYGVMAPGSNKYTIGGVKFNGTIYMYTQTPLSATTTDLSSAPASSITVIGYPPGGNPSGSTSLSRMQTIAKAVNTNPGSTTEKPMFSATVGFGSTLTKHQVLNVFNPLNSGVSYTLYSVRAFTSSSTPGVRAFIALFTGADLNLTTPVQAVSHAGSALPPVSTAHCTAWDSDTLLTGTDIEDLNPQTNLTEDFLAFPDSYTLLPGNNLRVVMDDPTAIGKVVRLTMKWSEDIVIPPVGGIPMGIATSVQQDGQPAGNPLVESTPAGGPQGVFLTNNGNLTLAGNLIVGTLAGAYTNVKGFGATGNGTIDDTAAIQLAINAAQAIGGCVFFPPGTYLISASLTYTSDVDFEGTRETVNDLGTILKLKAASNTYMLVSTKAINTTTTIKITNLTFDVQATSQTSASGAVFLTKPVHCLFDRVHITNAYDYAVKFVRAADSSFGHHNKFTGCLIDNGSTGNGRGILFDGCDENWVEFCDFEFNKGFCIEDNGGLQVIRSCVFVSSTSDAIHCDPGMPRTTVEGCVFDGGNSAAVSIDGIEWIVSGNQFMGVQGNQVALGEFGGGHIVTGNQFQSNSTNGLTTSFVNENPGLSGPHGMPGNLIADNVLTIIGTLATGPIVLNNPASKIHHNGGYNPIGHVTSPGIPATTVALANPFEVDAMVIVSGGTVTVIAIGGVATGLTSGVFRLPAGQTITLTYTVAPTWTWFGD